jgi:outer membrane protein OmpA-like peptidoglycan-associated protein
MSDMLNAAAPLNISAPGALAPGSASLIAQVQAAGLMPDCKGWHVYMLGAGQPASHSVGDVTYQQIQTFWTSFFARCGGQVVYYDSQLATFPVQATRQMHIKAKTVAIRSSAGESQQIVVTLPDDVLFASGSAQLSPEADPVLAQLLPIVAVQYPMGSVQVTGYTDSVPINIPGGNWALSKDRAVAVTYWLQQHGVASERLHAFGLGPNDPTSSNSTIGGQAANRRVVVAITR